MKLYVAVVFVALVIQLCDEFDVNCFGQDTAERVWVELHSGMKTSGGDTYLVGPNILRREGAHPMFIFQANYYKLAPDEFSVPYVIVVNDQNAFHLLTSLRVDSPSHNRYTTCGSILGPAITKTSFRYEIKIPFSELSETMAIRLNDVEFGEEFGEEFELKDGRVFELFVDDTGKTVVRQHDILLPDRTVASAVRGLMDSDDQKYQRMAKWWTDSIDHDR